MQLTGVPHLSRQNDFGVFPGTHNMAVRWWRMDHLFLSTICAGILLLVTAFALATPSMRTDVPPEKTVLLRIAAR
jgi:hypothetical protein